MDIFISNTYSAKLLSLSTGKKGQPGTHFNKKYQQEMNFISQQEITSQIGGRSFWLYEHPHFKYVLCNTFVSQQERDNQGLISIGNYKFRSVKLKVGVSGFMDILISKMYSARPLSLNGILQVWEH